MALETEATMITDLFNIAPMPAPRRQEFHVTVASDDACRWKKFCASYNAPRRAGHLKPLWIELNNFERQLMYACSEKVIGEVILAQFRIARVKHEVDVVFPEDTPVYYECHVKLDGRFRADLPWSSRDLYRSNRWYLTHRADRPFSALDFLEEVKRMNRGRDGFGPSTIAGMEYEACLYDSNPSLDRYWK